MQASFTILFLAAIAAGTAFWIWALVDVLRKGDSGLRAGSQSVWAIVIALTHTVGAAAYVAIGRARPEAQR